MESINNQSSDYKKRIIQSGVIYTFGDFLNIGISSFLVIPIYARFLPPSEYGLFGIVNFYISILGVVMMMGSHSSFSRYFFIHKVNGEEKKYLGSVVISQLIYSTVLVFLLLIFGKEYWKLLFEGLPSYLYFIIVVAAAFLAFGSGIYSMWLRVQEKPIIFLLVQLFYSLSLVILIGFFIAFKHLGILGAIYATVGATLCNTIVSIIALRPHFSFSLEKKYLRGSVKFGIWIMFGTIASVILNRSQLLVLQHYTDLKTVGIMNLALQLSGVITILSTSFGKAWQPYIYSSVGSEIMISRIKKSIMYYAVGIMFFALFISIFAGEIIAILAPKYGAAGVILRYLVIIAGINSLTLLSSTALLYEGRAFVTQLSVVGCAAINLVSNIFLVKLWQINGAILSLIFACVFNLIVTFSLSRKIIGFHELKILFKIFLISLIVWFFAINAESSEILLTLSYKALSLLFFYPLLLILVGIIKRDHLGFIYKYFGSMIKFNR